VPAKKKLEVIEDGISFYENALLKAQAYYQREKSPVLSDDSGLVVEALPDQLGVQTARFGGEGLTDKERYELLLEKLRPEENRSAYFICVLCFYISPQEIFYFEGRAQGSIALEVSGEGGFGYDPVFLPAKHPAQKSFADDPEFKKAHSHRAEACRQAIKFFT
jgi:XTP/dITP diphosphohydrolase